MAGNTSLIPEPRVEELILQVRRQRVIMDADLARLYGVTTKALNQAVKRNVERFPVDFMFQLTADEKAEVVTICDHLSKLKYSPSLPHAFTEHGALMAASVLNSPRAVDVSVAVVRAFVRLRTMMASHAELSRKIAAMEKKYDAQFKGVFDAIRRLMAPPSTPRRKIEFTAKDES